MENSKKIHECIIIKGCDHKDCDIDLKEKIEFSGKEIHDLYDLLNASSSQYYHFSDYDRLIKTCRNFMSRIEKMIDCKSNPTMFKNEE